MLLEHNILVPQTGEEREGIDSEEVDQKVWGINLETGEITHDPHRTTPREDTISDGSDEAAGGGDHVTEWARSVKKYL